MINKQEIFDDLEKERKATDLTFVNVEEIFLKHGFRYQGIGAITMVGYPHLIYWSGWNELAVHLLHEYTHKYNLAFVPVSTLYYLLDGKMLKIPTIDIYNGRKYTVKQVKNYKRDHWIPCKIDRVEND